MKLALCQSATNLSRRPIATGSLPGLNPLVHFISHCVSWGQTLPQTAGKELDSEMISYALSKFPKATSWIKSGILIFTGQWATHGLFGHPKHLFASSIAISAVYPSATSLKLCALTFGSWDGIGFFLGAMFGLYSLYIII